MGAQMMVARVRADMAARIRLGLTTWARTDRWEQGMEPQL